MALLDRETGDIAFSDGTVYSAVCRHVPDAGSHEVNGGSLFARPILRDGRPVGLSLTVDAIRGTAQPTEERKRQFLYRRLALRDDGLAQLRAVFPFGELCILTDPVCGSVEALLFYRVSVNE